MKKIYFIGDIINNNGPAIVNKSYKEHLFDKVKFCNSNNKIIRTLHFVFYLPFSNILVISGYSKLNYILLKIGKILKKKTFYLMHGYIKKEAQYKKTNLEKSILFEYKILKNANKIICVSNFFSEYLKKELPEFKNKITFVNNGINNLDFRNYKNKNNIKYVIMSVGGGLKQKNNLAVCHAIEKINKESNIKYIIVGPKDEFGDILSKYEFVEYYENLPHNEVIKLMKKTNLYIQNSYFETFGLSIVEAINCGCDILLSKNIGVLSILENLDKNTDIINDNENIDELTLKIKNKIKLKKKTVIKYDSNKCSWLKRSKELLNILNER